MRFGRGTSWFFVGSLSAVLGGTVGQLWMEITGYVGLAVAIGQFAAICIIKSEPRSLPQSEYQPLPHLTDNRGAAGTGTPSAPAAAGGQASSPATGANDAV